MRILINNEPVECEAYSLSYKGWLHGLLEDVWSKKYILCLKGLDHEKSNSHRMYLS